MRPIRSTSVISATRRPAPELASIPRWVTCQSEATPSLALYWHIGETTIRLASSRSASRIGENNALMCWTVLSGGWDSVAGADHRERREGCASKGMFRLRSTGAHQWPYPPQGALTGPRRPLGSAWFALDGAQRKTRPVGCPGGSLIGADRGRGSADRGLNLEVSLCL